LFFRDMTFVSCLGSHLLRNRPQFLWVGSEILCERWWILEVL
jgi:hypothetical protein